MSSENHPPGDSSASASAMLEFLGTFRTLSGSSAAAAAAAPERISDLGDGVALFEALSEMYVFSFFVSRIRRSIARIQRVGTFDANFDFSVAEWKAKRRALLISETLTMFSFSIYWFSIFF